MSSRVEDAHCVRQKWSINDSHITGYGTRGNNDAHVRIALKHFLLGLTLFGIGLEEICTRVELGAAISGKLDVALKRLEQLLLLVYPYVLDILEFMSCLL